MHFQARRLWFVWMKLNPYVVFQQNVMLQIFFQQFSRIHECYDQEEETGGSVDIMTQNFLINTSNSYYDLKLPRYS